MGTKHHFIPCMYLHRFATGSGRDACVTVLDKFTGRILRDQRVENVAFENGLYRVPPSVIDKDDASRLPEGMRHVDGLETMFEVIETAAAPLLDWVSDHARLPDAWEDMEHLLWFLLMLETRNPDRLEHLRQMEEKMVNLHAKVAAFNDPSLFDGPAPELELPASKNRHRMVGASLNLHETLMPYMMARKWMLHVSTVLDPVICPDVPLGIDLLRPTASPFGGAAHGIRGTLVNIPLSRSLLLSGRFEGRGGVQAMDRHIVALANTLAFNRAQRFVYVQSTDFPVLSIPAGGSLFDAMLGRFRVQPFPLAAFQKAGQSGLLRKPKDKVDVHFPEFLDRPREEFLVQHDESMPVGWDELADAMDGR